MYFGYVFYSTKIHGSFGTETQKKEVISQVGELVDGSNSIPFHGSHIW